MKFAYLLLLFALFFSCQTVSTTYEAKDFSVTWEMQSPIELEDGNSKCVFTITNNGTTDLVGNNWILYFSQLPRKVVKTTPVSNATVEQISGDWHRLVPTENFVLKAGESHQVTYFMSSYIIKNTDAALAPYFVFLDENGEEQSVANVEDYKVLPFKWAKAVAADQDYNLPIKTVGEQYEAYAKLTQLPAETLSPITPSPLTFQRSGERKKIDDTYEIVYADGLETAAQLFAAQLQDFSGLALPIVPKATAKAAQQIQLLLQTGTPESYTIDVTGSVVQLIGGDAAGLFYATQSFLQLIPYEALAEKKGAFSIPAIQLQDQPRFPYRGLHLDLGRNFQSKAQLLKMIDLISFYKVNKLVLGLSEDEGWRIEIEELPELTTVGSKRGHSLTEANCLHPAYGSGANIENPYGTGYYTRADYKEIIQYAAQRQVEVIPMINLPAHARAAIVAMEARYQKFMASGDEEKANEFRLIDPDDTSVYYSAQAYQDNVICVARPSVFKFYETVIDDIIEMHEEADVPLQFFHTGGDEVPQGAWEGSPLCQKLLAAQPEIGDPHNLQGYFFDRVIQMLEARDLTIGGWQEVAFKKDAAAFELKQEYATGKIVPYVWLTLGREVDLGYRMANLGYPVVLCNVQNLYFDLAYTPSPDEPGLFWGGFVDTKSPWEFTPVNLRPAAEFEAGFEGLTVTATPNILGVQAQIWSETIKGSEMLEYYTLPKLISFAERAWKKDEWESAPNGSSQELLLLESWNQFSNRLGQVELPRLPHMFGGYNYRVPPPGVLVGEGQAQANVAFPGLSVRYTTDGSEPTAASSLLTKAIPVADQLKFKAFDLAGSASKTVEIE